MVLCRKNQVDFFSLNCILVFFFFFFFFWIWNKLLCCISYSILLGWMPGNDNKNKKWFKEWTASKHVTRNSLTLHHTNDKSEGGTTALLGLTSPWSPNALTVTTAAYLVTIKMIIFTSFTSFDIISHLLLLKYGTEAISYLLIPLRSFLSSFQPLFHQWHLLSFFELQILWISMQ